MLALGIAGLDSFEASLVCQFEADGLTTEGAPSESGLNSLRYLLSIRDSCLKLQRAVR